jgi:hypothetical protein
MLDAGSRKQHKTEGNMATVAALPSGHATQEAKKNAASLYGAKVRALCENGTPTTKGFFR